MKTFRKKHCGILYASPQVCNIESAIQLSPIAIIAIVGICIDALTFFKDISAKYRESIVVYIAGIIFFDRKQTAALMANQENS